MNENQKEIQRLFWQQQEKYVYYILGLTVSAMGFAIYKTSGLPLKSSQITLGLSVTSWGISIFCGLRFIKYAISNLYAINIYFDIIGGRHPNLGSNTHKIAAGMEGAQEAMASNAEKASKYFNWQGRLFYAGILLFIVWHIVEMYYTGITIPQ